MRRPSPLPPPRRSTSESDPPTWSENDRRAEPVRPPSRGESAPPHRTPQHPAMTSPHDEETTPLDEVREWYHVEPDPVPEEPAEPALTETVTTPPEPADEPTPDPEPAESIGIRDVWRAARARRRALRAEVRRFTVRSRRRRAAWLGSIAAVLILIGGSFAVAYSPLFAVETISIVGAQRLDVAAVEQALASQVGTPLAAVDDTAIRDTLAGFPLVETYSVQAHPPHDLVIRVVERTPVGMVRDGGSYALVDAAGVVLSTSSTVLPGQPVIDVAGGTASPAFASTGLVIRALPESVRGQLTGATATTPDDVTLTLGGKTKVVWGSAVDSALKAIVLEKAMIARPPDTVSAYDVSTPAAIIVR